MVRTDNAEGTAIRLGPWDDDDQPVECVPQIRDGLPGVVFHWDDGRTRAIFLNPSTSGSSADVFVYRSSIAPDGEQCQFDPSNDADAVCFIDATREIGWLEESEMI